MPTAGSYCFTLYKIDKDLASFDKPVEDEESLQSSALVSKFPDAVKHQINEVLAHGVVTTGVIVGGILFASDQLLGVEQLAVCAGADLV